MLSVRLTDSQRFEYKYLVTEAQAELVRGFAQAHLVADRHARPAPDHQYPVYSLYLDSRDLRLYASSRDGNKNRFKLRVRFYDDRPDTPAFAEVKARKNDTIHKQRAALRKERVAATLSTFCPSTDDLVASSAAGAAALDRFCELGAVLTAEPKAIVRYTREAYVAPGDGALRLTMDRDIACLRVTLPVLELDGPGWISLSRRWVVLEIKFTDTFPAWAREMVRALELVRTSAAKYVRSIEALGRAGMSVA